ncbi:helix-turn-helix domain-containing protein [Fructobacillus americanaquae]|uniref:Helix-turn-helix domain-containing protein n=1 Tax=Fructobacillus americanaquae TaxID=2940302 RepID=A0ABY5BZQ9_9LACO|nr:helix-turn-helix transcriptional regulator [Fructobacillus americanaquae]USS92002.1 helix-turn-helix domain-containing protein [Fructobacillus americanaquae]
MIGYLRNEKGLSMAKLSLMLRKTDGFSKTIGSANISQYKNDNREPKLETLEKLAKFYGVTPAYLAGWEE